METPGSVQSLFLPLLCPPKNSAYVFPFFSPLEINLISIKMWSALAPNSYPAENTHPDSVSRPKVGAITEGGQFESHALAPLYASPADPSPLCQSCLRFGFSNSTFEFPTGNSISWHFLSFLFGSATPKASLSSVQARPPAHCCSAFWLTSQTTLGSLSLPGCPPSPFFYKPFVNSTFWTFLSNPGQLLMRKGQVVASRWSVCHLNTLLGAFFLVTMHAAEGLYPMAKL